MSVPLLLVALTTFRVAPFVAILSTERVECVCKAVDNAFSGFLGPGTGDGEDGDEVLVFEAAIKLGPFVVFGGREASRGGFSGGLGLGREILL